MSTPKVRVGIRAFLENARAFFQARRNIDNLNSSTRRMGSSVRANRRIIQQAGMQMSDFAVQVGGGQDAILAFTQNAPQFIQQFGAMGGALAAFVTIAGTLALVMVRTGTSISQITPLAGALEDEFVTLVAVLKTTKEFFIDVANVMINNLDRVLVYIATFAGMMAGKWVIAFVAARGAVTALVTVLTALRAILLTFARLAIFVLFAELVFTFVKLFKATGSFGEALNALRPLGESVARVIGEAFSAAGSLMHAGITGAAAGIMVALGKLDDLLVGMIRGSLKGLVEIVAFLTQRDMGHLTDQIDGVSTSFTRAAEMGKDLAISAAVSADLAAVKWGRVRDAVSMTVDEHRKLHDLVKSGGSDIDIRNFFKGIEDGAEGAGKSVKDLKTIGDKLADSFKSGFDNLFSSMFQGSEAVIQSLRNLGIQVLNIIAKQSFFKLLAGSFPSLFGSKGMFDLTTNANGNAFRGGSVTAFAKGGIVGGPTVFPMRRGAGLMGEAGPEAIMPLTRRNGRLGVDASGLGQQPVNITVVNEPGVQTSYEPTMENGQLQHRFVARQINRSVEQGGADTAFASRFGVRPQGVKR